MQLRASVSAGAIAEAVRTAGETFREPARELALQPAATRTFSTRTSWMGRVSQGGVPQNHAIFLSTSAA